MQAGTVQMLISILDQSFRELGVDASPEILESLAVTVHHAMTGDTRQFHHGFNPPQGAAQVCLSGNIERMIVGIIAACPNSKPILLNFYLARAN